MTTPWSVNWLAHANDAAGLTDLGYSAWEQSLVGSADLQAWLTTGAAGASLIAMSDDADNLTVAGTLEQDHVLDVRWYGAAGDGIADDTAEIQAAIAAAAVAPGYGATVYFPPGVYLISATLVTATMCGCEVLSRRSTTREPGTQSRSSAIMGRSRPL